MRPLQCGCGSSPPRLPSSKCSPPPCTATSTGEADRAHLQLLQQPGAGAWLQARPAEALGLSLDPSFFRVLLRMRLRLPVASSETYCPFCDGVADRFGDHARICPCGGDRCKRHNRLRTLLAERAAAAGLSPEIEKPDLLPARPAELGACEAGAAASSSSNGVDLQMSSCLIGAFTARPSSIWQLPVGFDVGRPPPQPRMAPMLVPLTSSVNARTLTRPPSASNRGYGSCP